MHMLKPDNRTCDWLFSNETFNTWLRSRKGLLWIRGNPGCGKSMSMKRTLEYLQDQSDAPQLLAHFFFHGQGNHLQKSPLGLYRSLLHQLYLHLPGCFSDLTQKFEKYRQQAPNDWRWTSGELQDFLLKGILSVSCHTPTILLVDALDEAGESEAKAIANDLKSLMNTLESEQSQLRICFSCRHYPQVTLSSGETLVMDEANLQDIQTVVTSRIDSAICFSHFEQDQLKSEILSKAAGSFQWASLISELVIDTKEKGDSFKIALKTIQKAPRELELLYKSLLDIKHGSESFHQRRKMLKLFQWVTFAARPLALEELQQALALGCNMTEQSTFEYKSKDTFIATCDMNTKVKNLSRGLVRFVESKTGEVQAVLIHQSVFDFFVSGGLRLLATEVGTDITQLAHFQLSRSCLKYLSMKDIQEQTESLPELLFYAWDNWAFHTVQAKGTDSTFPDGSDHDLLDFFRWPKDEEFLSAWKQLDRIHQLGYPSFVPYHGSGMHNWLPEKSRLVHLLAFLGVQSPLRYIAAQHRFALPFRTRSKEIMVKDALGRSPLIYALQGEEKEMVRFLAQAGAKINGEKNCKPNLSPLVLASRNQDPEFSEILLAEGAKVNSRIRGTSILHVAVIFNNEDVVRMLLDEGANVHAKDEAGRTPLHCASTQKCGTSKIALMLLDHGADPNDQAFNKMTPLHMAVISKNTSVITVLVKKGASIHAKERTGYSSVRIALRSSSAEVLKALVSTDYDFTSACDWNSDGMTPLHFAAKRNGKKGHGTVVPFLINRGADVNAKCRLGTSPLHWVRSSENARQLIEAGADIGTRDCAGFTPLHCAAWGEFITTALIQMGADAHINAKCRNGMTPLHWVEYPGPAERLIEAGADIDSRDLKGHTPLHHAAFRRNKSVMKILLQKGADPKVKGHEEDVALLIDLLNGEYSVGVEEARFRRQPRSREWYRRNVTTSTTRKDLIYFSAANDTRFNAESSSGSDGSSESRFYGLSKSDLDSDSASNMARWGSASSSDY